MRISLIIFLVLAPGLLQAAVSITEEPGPGITLANEQVSRSISLQQPLRTQVFGNGLDGHSLKPTGGHEFVLHLADDRALTPADFEIVRVEQSETAEAGGITVHLKSAAPAIDLRIGYSLQSGQPWLRKQLTICPAKDLAIASIELESWDLAEAYQPYTISQITAKGASKWRPGIGQPLYTSRSGSYWGVEFPAAVNKVDNGRLICSYRLDRTLAGGESYRSHPALFGVADSPDFVKAAFFDYIDASRVRPLRLQTQYNSWFDYGGGVKAESFATSVRKVHDELVTQRGVPPLRAYVIDDGWQDTKADWTGKVWQVNDKFDDDFAPTRKLLAGTGSDLGLWLSPGCLFGAQRAIPAMKAGGFRSLDPWMSMADPAYMDKLEERMVELAGQGVSYFKLDGIFGHLNTRNFDVPGFKGAEQELNDPKFDDAKIAYLSAGTERLIQTFAAVAKARPDVYIVISNGAWLSPWWLQHIDAVWMINAGDAAGGSSRTRELVYRDSRYHGLAVGDNTQFPLHSIFNHEPKKTRSHETKGSFRRYLYMNLSRGTGFVELYIKPAALKAYDWDVLAEGLQWAHDIFPTFKHTRMHGGDPSKDEIYGYTAWLADRGYVSLHNPSAESRNHKLTLDRAFGLDANAVTAGTVYHLTSPIPGCTRDLDSKYRSGSTLELVLKPGEIRILNFDVTPKAWDKLVALQNRTKEDFVAPKPIPVKGHPLLGTWVYGNHSREFKQDGTCTLKSKGKIQWTKPFTAAGPDELVVEGGYTHKLRKNGTLDIEGRYSASRKKR